MTSDLLKTIENLQEFRNESTKTLEVILNIKLEDEESSPMKEENNLHLIKILTT